MKIPVFLTIAIAFILTSPLAMASAGHDAQGWDYQGQHMMMTPFANSGSMFFTGFVTILFWVVIIVGAILLVKAVIGNNGKNKDSGKDSALETLKQRYAKGEIDKNEFEQKKKDLNK